MDPKRIVNWLIVDCTIVSLYSAFVCEMLHVNMYKYVNNVPADVLFELEDGTVPAHRALLMCRCDMMVSMFNLDFNERFNRTVSAVPTDHRTLKLEGSACMTFDIDL